jgi:hypothetical protein
MYVVDESIDELNKILLLILGCAVQVINALLYYYCMLLHIHAGAIYAKYLQLQYITVRIQEVN